MTLFSKEAILAHVEGKKDGRPSHSFRKEIIAHLLIDLAEVWSWFTAIFQRKFSMTVNDFLYMRLITNVVVLR